MQTSLKLSKDIVFCKDPNCEDIHHVYFIFGALAFYGVFRFELTGLA